MINKCNRCEVVLVLKDNWLESQAKQCKYWCRSCMKTSNAASNPIQNPKNMYINGKYISRSHPLHKAGIYKSFGDAAFAALSNYNKSKEGEVYAIENKAWDGWIKIGMAVDAEDRLNSYQTSSPLRDYVLLHKVFFTDRRKAESTAHKLAAEVAKERMNEWFLMSPSDAIKIINGLDISPTNDVEQLKDNQGYYK